MGYVAGARSFDIVAVQASYFKVAPPLVINTPADVPNLSAWFDASDAASITETANAISQWNDKSGNGLHLTQATASLQPIRSGTQNGLSTVVFDGVDDYMDTASFTLPQPFTICMATDLGSDTTQAYVSSIGGNFQFYTGGVGRMDLFGGSNSTINISNSGVHTWMAIANGSTSQLSKDGAVTAFPSGIGGSGTTTGLRVGAIRDLAAGYRLQGSLLELVIYSRALSSSECKAVENYFTKKWFTYPGVPPTIPNLTGWYDASDASTITQTADAVSQWTDKSISRFHVSQATGTKQPLTNTNTINGKNVITFDGVGSFLQSSAAASAWSFLHDGTPYELFAVMQKTGGHASARLMGTARGVGSTQGFMVGFYDSGVINHYVNAMTPPNTLVISYLPSTFAGSINIPNIVSISGDPANATASLRSFIRANGIPVTGANAAVGAPVTSAPYGSLSIGADALGEYWFGGHIAEIIIYNRALTTTERQQIESYLKAKWGTP